MARAIAAHLKPGQTFWDIGANAGWFSLFADQIVGADGHVVAFEPSPASFRALAVNARAARSVESIQCGVGSADGKLVFHAQGQSAAASFVSEVTQINAHYLPSVSVEPVEVDVRTVDSLVAELASVPDLVKIDVEGYELEVLRGAGRMLATAKPTLVIEVHPRQLGLSGGSEAQLFQYLRDRGYDWSEIHRNPNSLYTVLCRAV